MRSLNCFLGVCLALFFVPSSAAAQVQRPVQLGADTAQSAAIRSEGAFLEGMGWYNLRTAQATKVEAEAQLLWNKGLREEQDKARSGKERDEAFKKLSKEEQKRKWQEREYQLRATPTELDVTKGDALNALVYDLFDANTVDYAKEILIDTQEHDASTVGELVAFTRKYRLQFSSAERNPGGPRCINSFMRP